MPDDNRTRAGSEPRSESEIIPPYVAVRSQWRDSTWSAVDEQATRRIYVTKLGPFGIVVLALAVGLVAALLLVLLVGALLLWIPIAAALVTIAIISAFLRPPFRR